MILQNTYIIDAAPFTVRFDAGSGPPSSRDNVCTETEYVQYE